MSSTGILNGTLAVIKVAATAVAHLTSNDISFEMATREATTKDSAGNKETLEGLKSFSGSGSGYFAEDASYGFEDLYDVIDARTPVTVRWSTGVVGDTYYEAILKAMLSVGYTIPKKNILLSTGPLRSKVELVNSCKMLIEKGYNL